MIMKSIMTGDEAPGKRGNETEMKARSTGKGGLGTMKRKRTKKSMGDKAIWYGYASLSLVECSREEDDDDDDKFRPYVQGSDPPCWMGNNGVVHSYWIR